MTDFDSDDFDDLGGLFEEAGAPTPSPTARALVSGETGVQFDALVLFAEPLLTMYGLDLADAFALKANPDEAPLEVLTVLETARVLWAFFSLPPSERVARRAALAARLVGPSPSEEDWIDIEALLETVEPYWKALLPEEIEAAQATTHETLDFDALVQHPAFHLGDAAAGLGPDGLSEVEARALFAQPLLDDPETLLDADAFEAAMERANAYWLLARRPAEELEDAIRETAASLAKNGEAERIAEEARRMVERYRQLFPEPGG